MSNAERLISSVIASHDFLALVKTALWKQNLFSFSLTDKVRQKLVSFFFSKFCSRCSNQMPFCSGYLPTVINESNAVVFLTSPYIHDDSSIFICNSNIKTWTCAYTFLTLQIAICIKDMCSCVFFLFQVSEILIAMIMFAYFYSHLSLWWWNLN